ncbi:DUF4157 domain-containing protein [Haliangium sp.]|uniref:eCIS core domain-containing protein n=1 Tax=Haliangium sp. TaxID=2663208 RepID=UPI003D0E6ACE
MTARLGASGAAPMVQRKASAGAGAGAKPRSAWELTQDPWMDLAHRGVMPSGGRGLPVQGKGAMSEDSNAVHHAAATGVGGSGGALPHLDRIQAAFGGHDVSHVRAHVGGAAKSAGESIGAQAYAMGEHVAFNGQPDLHTAAHEAAHVIQQQRGVQLQGGVGQAGDAYERHADAVADRVVAGESADDLLAAGPGAGGGAGASVQRQPIETGYGTFTDEAFTDIELSSNHKKVGVDIHLSFTPNDKVEAGKIGMMQAVKSVNEGTPVYMNEADQGRTVKDGDAAGYQIDRAYGNNNPVYGSDLAEPGKGLGDTAETNAPTGETPDVSNGGNATYVLGHRVKKGEKDWDAKKAEMHDAPQLGFRGANAGQEFETTALALEGPQKDTYYGSVRWGWKSDGAGEFEKIELIKVSDAGPSKNFTEAAKAWNDYVFSPRINTPKEDGSTKTLANLTVSNGGRRFTVGANTELNVDLNDRAYGNDMFVTLAESIRLKDGGVYFMGWVEQDALDGDTMKADTEMQFQGENAMVARGTTVKRTGSVVGTRELVMLKEGVVSNLVFDHRLVLAEVLDMKGGETVDLPGAE